MKPDARHMTPPDSELIRQAQAGDLVAFESLVQRYDRRVLTIAASYVHSSDDAKDIYQEVFLRVYKALPKFESRSEFSTWLFRVTTNVCITHRSRAKRHQHDAIGEESDEEHGVQHQPVADRTTEGDVHRNEIATRVREALGRLSPRQRLVFTLRHYEGFKLKEIAVLMTLSEGAVKKYLFEANGRLRTHLHDLVAENG